MFRFLNRSVWLLETLETTPEYSQSVYCYLVKNASSPENTQYPRKTFLYNNKDHLLLSFEFMWGCGSHLSSMESRISPPTKRLRTTHCQVQPSSVEVLVWQKELRSVLFNRDYETIDSLKPIFEEGGGLAFLKMDFSPPLYLKRCI